MTTSQEDGDIGSDPIMMELFKVELENQLKLLSSGLLQLEESKQSPELLTGLMRAAHSLKGAARVVRLAQLSELAHAMEDCFVAVQKGSLSITPDFVDKFLVVIDFLTELNTQPVEGLIGWLVGKKGEITSHTDTMRRILHSEVEAPPKPEPKVPVEEVREEVKRTPLLEATPEAQPPKAAEDVQDRVLRVTAQSLNRLMGLAGESLVESRWLSPFSAALLRLKKDFNQVSHLVDLLRNESLDTELSPTVTHNVHLLEQWCNTCRESLNERLADLELFINRNASLSDRLYREVIQSRMRAFNDGVEPFMRMVRDISRQLDKRVQLEIRGKDTPVDRDILEKLEAPLGHLLRNAIDHGIETSAERVAAGKSEVGHIILEAEHRGGMLSITLKDDGAGINLDKIRSQVIKKGLSTPELTSKMTQSELIDFIFLPGFSSQDNVTEISGRGIGLNVVHDMIQEVSGQLSVSFVKGQGSTFSLRLPLTLSVIRSLIVEISGEPYAFPIGRIDRALLVPLEDVHVVENRQYFTFEGKNIGLAPAQKVIHALDHTKEQSTLSVVLINDQSNTYGLIVDAFLAEKDLVVQEIDHRLGKIPNISAGAFLEDGSPVLIFDVEDLIGSIDQVLGGASKSGSRVSSSSGMHSKKILVAEDSATVRELECRILHDAGYNVTGVVNGRDAWNALRIEDYDMVITDIDMPRMNGIELLQAIRADARLCRMPVVVISYKDREEDSIAGIRAGANVYLTKGSFTEEELIKTVDQLVNNSRV